MIVELPDLVVLKIVSFLQLPDLFNLLKYDSRIEKKITNYQKKFCFCDNTEKVTHIFSFDLPFLKINYEELIVLILAFTASILAFAASKEAFKAFTLFS